MQFEKALVRPGQKAVHEVGVLSVPRAASQRQGGERGWEVLKDWVPVYVLVLAHELQRLQVARRLQHVHQSGGTRVDDVRASEFFSGAGRWGSVPACASRR